MVEVEQEKVVLPDDMMRLGVDDLGLCRLYQREHSDSSGSCGKSILAKTTIERL
jgi:hypothetical protein